MRLDRNTTEGGDGKYAIIKLRRVREIRVGSQVTAAVLDEALRTLHELGVLDDSPAESEGEFFVMRLKDRYAGAALSAYAEAADLMGDLELSEDVGDLARRAGPRSAWMKEPN